MADAQVNQTGDQANTDQQQTQQQSLGWRAGLPDDLKANEVFTPFKTVGDFAKVHIETAGKLKEAEGKLVNAIFKPSEKATDYEKAAYRKSLGVPEKPEEYEFPKADEGLEHDPNMISWAQKTFHAANLSKEQAGMIGQAWDSFLKGLNEEEDKLIQTEMDDNQKKFRGLFKTDDEFKAALELNKRYWKKVTGEDLPAFVDGFNFTKFIHEHAKKYGEDTSLSGSQSRGTGEQKPGMIYDKTPQHQKK